VTGRPPLIVQPGRPHHNAAAAYRSIVGTRGKEVVDRGVARKPRVEFAGVVYHVLDRGDRREEMFLGDEDREMFLRTLGETCGRTGWRLHAYVLMSNHYHLLLETLQANLTGRDEMVPRMNEALARLALGTRLRSRSHCRSL
jgi:hypothetical protein